MIYGGMPKQRIMDWLMKFLPSNQDVTEKIIETREIEKEL